MYGFAVHFDILQVKVTYKYHYHNVPFLKDNENRKKSEEMEGKERNKAKCDSESTGRVEDNVMLLISMRPSEEVIIRRVLKEWGKEAWMLWAEKIPGLRDFMEGDLKNEQVCEG